MILCDVVGTVVMTVKHPALAAEKLLCCQPLDDHFKAAGAVIIAIDRAQAGVGDRVLVMREGNGCRQIIGREQGKPLDESIKMDWPVRSMVVGVVDRVDVDRAASDRGGSDRSHAHEAKA